MFQLNGYCRKLKSGTILMTNNESLKVNVYGRSLEAKTVAACLADNDFYVNNCLGLSCDLPVPESPSLVEPQLEDLIQDGLKRGLLKSKDKPNDDANIHWVVYRGNNQSNIVRFIVSLIAKKKGKQTIILTTNLPVGTHETIKLEVKKIIDDLDINEAYDVISIPLFFREGSLIQDFYDPPILLIGADRDTSHSIVEMLLSKTLKSAKHVRYMTGTEVEIVNNAVSAFLAMRVSFLNELALLLETKNIDFGPIVGAMSCDPRFGTYYNKPGCGFGGIALQESAKNIQNLFKDFSFGSLMMQATLDINENQKDLLFRKFWQFFGSKVAGKKVAVWGGAFRANTSSIINSPAIVLMDALISEKVDINFYDPMVKPNSFADTISSDLITTCDSMSDSLDGADALFIVTDWEEFRTVDLNNVKNLLNIPVIFDGRNLFKAKKMMELGFQYFGIGRGESLKKSN